MTTAWVIGSGGLLGSALYNALRRDGSQLFVPAARFDWADSGRLRTQISAAVEQFAREVDPAYRWEIHWAAGVGNMGSTTPALREETRVLTYLLELIAAHSVLGSTAGALSFASSAGAIYAGSHDNVITEDSEVAPTTPYAQEKLEQERLIESFVAARPLMRATVARVSTIYGCGQAREKTQGLLAHIARRISTNSIVKIYVPYDTIRDYIFVDDAAAALIRASRYDNESPRYRVKILASERPTTIAEIVSVFRRITRRPPRIVTSVSAMTNVYGRRIQFRSIALRDGVSAEQTSLVVGIAKLMASERMAFALSSRGRERRQLERT